MAKRKVTFEDPEEEEAPGPKRFGGGPGSRFSGKPSLDSDEEEEEEEEERWGGELGMADIPGQEAAPQWGADEAAVGQCPITPFNLEEEMESGSFDRAGNYRPRGPPQRPDPWLEALPWTELHGRPPRRPPPQIPPIRKSPPLPPRSSCWSPSWSSCAPLKPSRRRFRRHFRRRLRHFRHRRHGGGAGAAGGAGGGGRRAGGARAARRLWRQQGAPAAPPRRHQGAHGARPIAATS